MKNFYTICAFILLIGQLSCADQTEKRPVGRPKMIGPKLPPKLPGKVGRPPKNKGFILSESNNILSKSNNVPKIKPCVALATVNNIVPAKTGFRSLCTRLCFIPGGITGALIGYAGAQAVDVLSDAQQRKALAEKFSLNNVPKNFFTNELYKQEVGLEREEQPAFNNPIHNEYGFVPRTFTEPAMYNIPMFLKYGSGAVAITGLGYIAYKIYQKVYDNFIKNKKTIKNETMQYN